MRAAWATRRRALLADFIVVNMVARSRIWLEDRRKEAAERAQKRAERYYKV